MYSTFVPHKPDVVKQSLQRMKLEVKASWEVKVKLYIHAIGFY